MQTWSLSSADMHVPVYIIQPPECTSRSLGGLQACPACDQSCELTTNHLHAGEITPNQNIEHIVGALIAGGRAASQRLEPSVVAWLCELALAAGMDLCHRP